MPVRTRQVRRLNTVSYHQGMTTPRTRLGRVLTALFVPIFSAALLAAPAHASTFGPPCPQGSLICMWTDPYRQGTIAFYRASNLSSGASLAGSVAGHISSVWVRGNVDIRAFADPHCEFRSPLNSIVLSAGTYIGNLDKYGWNDWIRSIQPNGLRVAC